MTSPPFKSTARRWVTVLACVFAGGVRAAPKGEPGLLAKYTDGAQSLIRVVPNPNFALNPNDSIDPTLKPSFTATWTGTLNVVKREKYRFALDGSDAGTLQIDHHPVGADAVDLDVGEHAIDVAFARKPGAARQQLVWSADDFLPEPVPQAALLHTPAPAEVAATDEVERGRLLVESFNCTACHQTTSKGIVARQAPDLASAGDRLRPAWVAKWLEDPRAYRHNAMMPRVPLDAGQRADVTAYLVTLKNPGNKVKEDAGRHDDHIAAGQGLFESIGCASCHDKMKADADPQKFSLRGVGSKWLTGQLAAYLQNPLTIDHSGRMPSMLLSHDEARDLAEYLAESRHERFDIAPATQPVPSVARGKDLVQSEGCVRCHTVANPQPTSPAVSIALEDLHDGKGCLADSPTGKAMDYGLSAAQRKSIVAFVESIRKAPLVSASPTAAFYHKVATFGCTRCHELNGFKPVDETERIPSLTNVAARMRTEWINGVLTDRKRVRPWLHRRMPEFGRENVGDVAELAAAVSGSGPAEPVPTPTREEILAGQKIVGSGGAGLSCITCHGFNGVKPPVADDTRGPDITTVASRLRPDHFRRWVYDPKRVDPATPMPSFFDGVPVHEAAGKIETIYRYCATGTLMPPPAGWVDENNYTLIVGEAPVVQRCVMPNLNGGKNFPRGIAVGLPGLVNYCFDAETCSVKYAWSGGFIDMQPSWAQRGGNEVRVAGKRFWGTNVPELSIAGVKDARVQFGGYALSADGSPQWLYKLGDADVKESVRAAAKGFGIVRDFEIDAHGQSVSVRALDYDGVDVQCSAGPLLPLQVMIDNRGARGVTLPGTTPLHFSLTITSRDSK